MGGVIIQSCPNPYRQFIQTTIDFRGWWIIIPYGLMQMQLLTHALNSVLV